MKTLRPLHILLKVLLCLSYAVSAESYDVYITKKGSNVYKVDGSDVTILTRFCYVHAYSGKALLKSDGYEGELIFLDSDDTCSVKAVYSRSKSFRGYYDVKVNREADDWYGIVDNENYIKTFMCTNMKKDQSATLILKSGGSGQLMFEDGNVCNVDGVYTQQQL